MLAIIVRILGNENPPRDRPGKRLAVLQTILETEPEFPDVGKHYLVNRIWDTTYQSKVLALLNHHHASYSIIPFDWTITPTHEAICRYGIGINQARNAAILWGSTRARYTVVLDGDCQFTSEGMQPLLEEMQRGNYTYLSIPFRREAAERQEEPQLAFRADAPSALIQIYRSGPMTNLNFYFGWATSKYRTLGICRSLGNKPSSSVRFCITPQGILPPSGITG